MVAHSGQHHCPVGMGIWELCILHKGSKREHILGYCTWIVSTMLSWRDILKILQHAVTYTTSFMSFIYTHKRGKGQFRMALVTRSSGVKPGLNLLIGLSNCSISLTFWDSSSFTWNFEDFNNLWFRIILIQESSCIHEGQLLRPPVDSWNQGYYAILFSWPSISSDSTSVDSNNSGLNIFEKKNLSVFIEHAQTFFGFIFP